MYPLTQLRRNRRTAWLRNLNAEANLAPSNLVLPIFIVEGQNQQQQISSMPGIFRLSIDNVLRIAEQAIKKGISALALFPSINSELKSEHADEAYNTNNLVCRTIRAFKNSGLDIGIICDVALDPYTSHGHDGIFKNGDVDNQETIEVLVRQSLALAAAGVDVVAPSDMMDGRIYAIRNQLNIEGFTGVNILSYAAKYNSGFYGPFRDALNNNNRGLDKSTYQMDVRNIREAMREIEHDIAEGADMIMIKPGLPFLDVIYAASKEFNVSLAAYQVSGEYAMLKFAALAGAIDWNRTLLESLYCFKRAGAQTIFTYAALEAADLIISTQKRS